MNKKRIISLMAIAALTGTTIFSAVPAFAESTGAKDADGNWVKEEATITLGMGATASNTGMEAVMELAEETLGITIEKVIVPEGEDLDNWLKTNLASGSAPDIISYNTGAQLKSLNPSEYFADLSGYDFVDNLDGSFIEAASVDGKLYGVPAGSSQAGAIFYNKAIYEEYGLEIPKTWDEFIANCDVLKEAGETAIIGSYAEKWTTQVPLLADNYNVVTAVPDFPAEFEAGDAKYATTPEALRSWEKLEQSAQYFNSDYMATSYDDGCDMIVNGDGAHWIMLTQAFSNIVDLYGDEVNNIGVFAMPGDDADTNGLTVWMPGALIANKNAENLDAVLRFLDFFVSTEAMDAYTGAQSVNGPMCVKGYELPESTPEAIRVDLQKYFDEGNTAPAMEFMCSVKGSNCPSICQELGSGQTTAEEAAAKYDDDCYKMAVQLGIDWDN
ncbi:MAG TPA: extracellular solute-binding protein [Candidatus Blautia faecavium]|uniref:Extracellular solute-binding protein n=1 Tax=Candidatus Blautia faecavium TaxID=2838487 RepID=A0A9D2LVC5_9FIRM|nr:extracellular solute-binding protein [Candidatus Blautia faecavium]